MIAITPESRARASEKQANADLREAVGLDALSAHLAARVIRYAETLGLITPSSRRGRADWYTYTYTGLGILVQSAEVIADNVVRETGDSCDLEAYALRRLARRWRSWGAATYASERARRRAA